MSINYPLYVSQLSNLMVTSTADTNFNTFLPGCIDYAEQRLYRELNLLDTSVTITGTLSSGNRNFTFPSNIATIIVMESFNVIGSSFTYPDGTRNPVQVVSRQFVDTVYPSQSSGTGLPRYLAMIGQDRIILGPSPDVPYTAEVYGTFRPAPLSSGNSSTFLTQNLPDLFIAASMVFASGYMRDFGGQTDNPQQSAAWESQYQILFRSAEMEEVRKAYMSQGWTDKAANAIATPPRV